MKIFGDDGFRDIYSKGLMSEKFLNDFFTKLDNFLYLKKINKIIIGYDTRKTSFDIINLIQKKIKKTNSIIILKKPIPTPCLSYLAKKYPKSFLIMITASHFNKQYNGFKFFYNGKKINKKIENKILSLNHSKFLEKKPKILLTNHYKKYIQYINTRFKTFHLKKNILIDFSFGSSASFLNDIKFWKNFKKINFKFDFNNINEKCGSNNLKSNLNKNFFYNSDYVFAFDGDADRLSIYKKNYGIIEAEKVALIFAKYLYQNKKFKKIVSTNIINPSLEDKFKKMNIELIKTKVGDRNVIDSQRDNEAFFGFETSGHFSFDHFMDGLFSCALFTEIISKNEITIDKVLAEKFEFKLKLFNFEKKKLKKLKKILEKIKKFSKIIIRKSIWEDRYRVYIFYKTKNYYVIKDKISTLQSV